MWLRVQPELIDHRKVHTAGGLLGTAGAGRVLAVWLCGAAYATKNATDGFVPSNVLLDDRRFERRPADVVKAMVASGLLTAVEGGYQYHDWDEWNPSGAELLERRRRDRDRKRRERGFRSESGALSERTGERTSDGVRAVSESSYARAHGRARLDLDLDHSNNPRTQKQRPAGAHRVLVRLAHTVLDDVGTGAVTADEAQEELKCRAARARIDYDGRAVVKALDSAVEQRRRAG